MMTSNNMSRDITLRRDNLSALGPDAGSDKRHWDNDGKVVELQKTIYNLQTNSHYLERQLERLISMNPEMQEVLDKKAAETVAKLSEEQLNDQS